MRHNSFFALLYPRKLCITILLMPLVLRAQPEEIRQEAYLKSANPAAGQFFGYVAISGDTALVNENGAAHVFVRQGTNWTYQARLQVVGYGPAYYYEAAISGDTIVIGTVASGFPDAEYLNPGTVYVFVRNGTTWSQQAHFRASNARPADFFCHVAICGDTIVVAATEESSNSVGVNGDQQNVNAPHSGAAYIFTRTGTNWTQQAYLKASNTGAGDVLGYSVAISGDTVVVGAPGEDSSAIGVNGDQSNNGAPDSGAAYVFVREGTNWSQQAYLKAPSPGAGSVSISGDLVVAGRSVFVRSGTNWSWQAQLAASNAEPADDSGGWRRVAISGDVIAVGAPGEDSNATSINGDQSNNSAADSGAAYVFLRNGTNWIQQAYLKPSNTGIGDGFGNTVAVSGDTVIIGAWGEDSNASLVNGNQGNNSAQDSGAAYIFAGFAPPCTNCPPSFILQATNQLVLPGTNVILVAAARGPAPLHYQWRFEGTNIPAATNATYSFTNVSITNGHGNYSVVVSNEFGSVTSSNALIFVRITPNFVTLPVSQSVLQGQTATFTCVATGAPPIYYRWVLNGLPFLTNTTGVLTLTNVESSLVNGVRCSPFNAAGTRNGSAVSLIVLPDADRDGIWDAWETQFGLNTNSAADALLDLDGDGMINRDEYRTGTNPADASSALRLSILRTNGMTLHLNAESNVAYTVQFSTNVQGAAWQTLTQWGPTNTSRTVEIPDPDGSSNAARFYRVGATPAP